LAPAPGTGPRFTSRSGAPPRRRGPGSRRGSQGPRTRSGIAGSLASERPGEMGIRTLPPGCACCSASGEVEGVRTEVSTGSSHSRKPWHDGQNRTPVCTTAAQSGHGVDMLTALPRCRPTFSRADDHLRTPERHRLAHGPSGLGFTPVRSPCHRRRPTRGTWSARSSWRGACRPSGR
jgi:hypothetical protein